MFALCALGLFFTTQCYNTTTIDDGAYLYSIQSYWETKCRREGEGNVFMWKERETSGEYYLKKREGRDAFSLKSVDVKSTFNQTHALFRIEGVSRSMYNVDDVVYGEGGTRLMEDEQIFICEERGMNQLSIAVMNKESGRIEEHEIEREQLTIKGREEKGGVYWTKGSEMYRLSDYINDHRKDEEGERHPWCLIVNYFDERMSTMDEEERERVRRIVEEYGNPSVHLSNTKHVSVNDEYAGSVYIQLSFSSCQRGRISEEECGIELEYDGRGRGKEIKGCRHVETREDENGVWFKTKEDRCSIVVQDDTKNTTILLLKRGRGRRMKGAKRANCITKEGESEMSECVYLNQFNTIYPEKRVSIHPHPLLFHSKHTSGNVMWIVFGSILGLIAFVLFIIEAKRKCRYWMNRYNTLDE